MLLVEDDRGVRDATRLLLNSEGFEVVVAASLADALERVEEHGAPDLVISDYHLDSPQTGLDVIAALRARHTNGLKAILVSGDTSPAVSGLNVDELVRRASKPIQAEQLLELMSELLGEGRNSRDRACPP